MVFTFPKSAAMKKQMKSKRLASLLPSPTNFHSKTTVILFPFPPFPLEQEE